MGAFEVKYRKKPATSPGLPAIRIGIEPCVRITVGFIFPCGEAKVGGCTDIGVAAAGKALPKAMLAGSPAKVILDPAKDLKVIRKVFLTK
jgi:hypothetical protein